MEETGTTLAKEEADGSTNPRAAPGSYRRRASAFAGDGTGHQRAGRCAATRGGAAGGRGGAVVRSGRRPGGLRPWHCGESADSAGRYAQPRSSGDRRGPGTPAYLCGRRPPADPGHAAGVPRAHDRPERDVVADAAAAAAARERAAAGESGYGAADPAARRL